MKPQEKQRAKAKRRGQKRVAKRADNSAAGPEQQPE